MRTRTRKRPLQVVVEGGQPSAVILDIDEYRELLEKAEDVDDLKLLQRMREKPLRFRKLEEFLAAHSSSV